MLTSTCVWRPDSIIVKCLPQSSQSSFETRSLAEPRAHQLAKLVGPELQGIGLVHPSPSPTRVTDRFLYLVSPLSPSSERQLWLDSIIVCQDYLPMCVPFHSKPSSTIPEECNCKKQTYSACFPTQPSFFLSLG